MLAVDRRQGKPEEPFTFGYERAKNHGQIYIKPDITVGYGKSWLAVDCCAVKQEGWGSCPCRNSVVIQSFRRFVHNVLITVKEQQSTHCMYEGK
jgi:hypothetical protein